MTLATDIFQEHRGLHGAFQSQSPFHDFRITITWKIEYTEAFMRKCTEMLTHAQAVCTRFFLPLPVKGPGYEAGGGGGTVLGILSSQTKILSTCDVQVTIH